MSTPSAIYQVGAATITRVTEQTFAFDAARLFPALDPAVLRANASWLVPAHADHALASVQLSVHTWVIRLGGRVILVDTACGNGKDRPFGAIFHQLDTPYLERLAAAGVRPEDVDLVLITHLHVDHVGWNTRLVDGKWIPTFPNARYVFAAAERAFYDSPAAANRMMVFEDSVLPVIRAGLVDEIGDEGGTYLPGIRFIPTPGHCVGHMSIEIASEGQRALFWGDVVHHPIQVLEPDWSSSFCADRAAASVSRRRIFDYAADHDVSVFTSHFAGSSTGRIARDGHDGFVWRFAA
ncbi:MBL fold metallo-hydrolase [Trinickia acidisoli]|uniref:MBL fold metallo-hydrolase n=1 Tax=Trinickia acidisoli TaxID=2767482 RepID=UPI001A8FD519|nr:MBL fold metallo-hydrolase [Trinickia acidisoli]